MNKHLFSLGSTMAMLLVVFGGVTQAADNDAKLRIIAFGAHPDDCEIQAGGTAALWAAQGHKVKFVSTTNGDIGHWQMAGGPLAKRRNQEVQAAAKVLGIETEVLDIHDGEIMPTLENRQKIVRLIRRWQAAVVLTPRPNDYHPDHRYTSILVQDAAYMVTVPFFCPDTPHLKSNPVFLYYTDRFQKPRPSEPDIVVSIDAIVDKKVEALLKIESQFIEGGCNGHAGLVPKNQAELEARVMIVSEGFRARFGRIADKYRAELIAQYGKEKGSKVRAAEAFELCEYGRRPSPAELKKIFPLTDD